MNRVLSCLVCMLLLAPASSFASEPLEGRDLGPTPDFEYVDMKPLVLPVITERGVTQQVSVVISLEVPYGKTEIVKYMMPKLADAYLSDLYGALGAGQGLMKGSLVNVPAIKIRLAKNTERVLGPDRVHDVVIQVVQQSPR